MPEPIVEEQTRSAPAVLDYAQGDGRMLNTLKRLPQMREFMIVLIILAGSIGMSIKCPIFLNWDILLSLLLSFAVEAIVAIGMTVLLVSGGFDLSVGSTVGMTGAVAAWCMVGGMPVPVAVVAALATGILIGCVNGTIIAKLGINPFITTLAMMRIVRGLLEVFTGGRNISNLPESFNQIGQGYFLGIQYPIVIAIVLVIVGDLLLRRSRFFRQNYYIGGNEKAATLSGINVPAMTIFNYALIGFLAAVAGVVSTARFGAATTGAAEGMELKVISAVIVGGASLQGGEGTVLGSFLGALLMALIVTSLPLLGVGPYWTKFVIGATLMLAVMIDTLGKRMRR